MQQLTDTYEQSYMMTLSPLQLQEQGCSLLIHFRHLLL